jgi:outer membrane protein assembly factor BamA
VSELKSPEWLALLDALINCSTYKLAVSLPTGKINVYCGQNLSARPCCVQRCVMADSIIERLRDRLTRFMLMFLILVATSTSHAADAIPGEQWCDRIVNSISFEGNRVTQAHVISRELQQLPGEPCSLDNIIDGVQSTQDLGLFKSVRAELRIDNEWLELVYIVSEKIFFLPIPRLSRTSDGELRYGAQLRWDNFLGRLHQLKLTFEKRQENDGQGRAGYVHSVDYSVLRFFGSRFGMAVSLDRIRRNSELAQDGVIYGEVLRESQRAEFRLARWAKGSTGVQGFSYFLGLGFENRSYDVRSGTTGPFQGGQNATVLAGFDLQRVHQDSFNRRGYEYGAALRLADSSWGADFKYAQLDSYIRWFRPLARPQTNLNVQLRLGLSTMAPFGGRGYAIGGGEVIRGMRTGDATGDILTLANVEYLSGFFSYPALRWIAFSDIGNVFLKDDVKLHRQILRGGLGLRWKLEALTNTDLRFDVAWDPKRSKLTPYLSSSLTF